VGEEVPGEGARTPAREAAMVASSGWSRASAEGIRMGKSTSACGSERWEAFVRPGVLIVSLSFV
jgi:hypothetical protein